MRVNLDRTAGGRESVAMGVVQVRSLTDQQPAGRAGDDGLTVSETNSTRTRTLVVYLDPRGCTVRGKLLRHLCAAAAKTRFASAQNVLAPRLSPLFMAIRLYDSLSRELRELKPSQPD